MPDIAISSRSIAVQAGPPDATPADAVAFASYAPRHRRGAYDNPFAPDNVYGHAVALLSRHRVKSEGALHIDIGCGFGRMAEPLVAALELTYLACDLDAEALGSLAQRGFETHRLVLDTEDRTYHALMAIIAGRKLASISMIDTLEHLDDPAAALRAVSRIAAQYQAFVLISVPNTAHRDLGMRLMFGLWDYTETGILDHTHRCLFSDSVLRRMLSGNGLHIIDANDVETAVSDQAFPEDHPAMQRGTHLHRLLCELRDLGDAYGSTNQLVRLCVAGPAAAAPQVKERGMVMRPLLSVLIRSEGRQPDMLAEVMTCLSGQTVTDFEILILGHNLDRPRQIAIEQVLVELPAWLGEKIRLLRIDRGNRTGLLNEGFAVAAGRYVTVLDEDDLVFAHWAENFMHAAARAPGQILRCAEARQTIRRVEYNYATGIRSESAPLIQNATEFDPAAHLRADCAPLPGLGFPRGLFHHLNLKFDSGLEIFAGWDYLFRGAALASVTSVAAVTAIHRQRNDFNTEAVEVERANALRNLCENAAPLWAGLRDRPGHAAQMAIATQDRLTREAAVLRAEIATMTADTLGHRQALRDVLTIYGSASWCLTAPLRFLARLRGRQSKRAAPTGSLSTAQLQDLARQLRISRSWRMTERLRRICGSGNIRSNGLI